MPLEAQGLEPAVLPSGGPEQGSEWAQAANLLRDCPLRCWNSWGRTTPDVPVCWQLEQGKANTTARRKTVPSSFPSSSLY